MRSGVLWGYIFGVAIASSEITYGRIYKTAAQRDALAATYGTSKAMSALFGPAPQLQTVSGFTVFKISMTLMILGAVWGLLTSTRLLRGEEESGRWDLFLCGQTTRAGAAAQAIAGLGAGLATLWGVTAIITVVSGQLLKCWNRPRSVALLRFGRGGHRGHVPRRWGRDQPAGGDPPSGGVVCGCVPRSQLRRATDRRRRRGSPRTRLGLPAWMGGGASTAHLAPTPGPAANRSLYRCLGRSCGEPRWRRATSGRASWRTGTTAKPTSDCSTVRADWRSA